ncbi:thaumatin-like protein 1a isoform X2 [Glycine soja]|uniref:thaumatin-like protein 1a isoform X2 n=1 Tax=Glycine soja TaxID=3848 RepID=UPI00104014C7|nr:thaumatin-like protein 1a isoform X2 [Glycine soja]
MPQANHSYHQQALNFHASKSSFSLDAPDGWSGRFWGRTHCSKDPSGKFTCGGADCGSGEIPCNDAGAIPPASLMELTLASECRMLRSSVLAVVEPVCSIVRYSSARIHIAMQYVENCCI